MSKSIIKSRLIVLLLSLLMTVPVFGQLSIDVTGQDDESCRSDADGSAEITTVTGGDGSYTYQWDALAGGGTEDNVSNLSSDPEADLSTSHTYTVIVTDGGGLTASQEFTITYKTEIIASIGFPNLNQPSCYLGCDGTATAIVEGSSRNAGGSYTYFWGTGETTEGATALCEGLAVVTITDVASMCFGEGSINLGSKSITVAPTFDLGNTNDPTCNGASDGKVTR